MIDNTPTPIDTEIAADAGTDSELIEKLKASAFYQTYQNAFRTATGLPLVLIPADRRMFNPCYASANQNPFCQALNTGAHPCSECVLAQEHSLEGAVDHANSTDCFAGIKETAVPLKLGKRVVGYLKTGQIFTKKPGKAILAKVEAVLCAAGRPDAEVESLIALYKKTPVLGGDQYASMITLLSAFGLQLAVDG